MARPRKFEGERLNHVVSLLRNHGASDTRKILAKPAKRFGKPTGVEKFRNLELFPDPVSVSLLCLLAIAEVHNIKFVRGRKSPFKTQKQRRYVAKLVRKNGAMATVDILANDERDKSLFPEPIKVSVPHVCQIAHDNGVKLKRGRRAA